MNCLQYMYELPPSELLPSVLKVSVGATIAFAMEISEFLVVTYTSSLTLSIAGIFKVLLLLIGWLLFPLRPFDHIKKYLAQFHKVSQK